MKLSVITPTCRSNPRFAEMAATLLQSFMRAPATTLLEWLIVDEVLWRDPPEERLAPITEALATLPLEVRQRIHVDHFAPPPGQHRGPDIADPLPAHNTARNAGLAAVAPDSRYVIILSDCSLVTSDWVTVACELAQQHVGWKCRLAQVHDLVVPHHQPLRYQDAWDTFHPVAATTVAGPCWGAPLDAFLAVGGFDADYDGEDDYYDHEILLRLSRVGIQFHTTKRAGVVRLRRTLVKHEVTNHREVLHAKRNVAFYRALAADRDRLLPGGNATGGAQLGRGAPHQPPRPAPAPAPARVAPPVAAGTRRVPGAGVPPARPAPARPAAAPAADHRLAVGSAVTAAPPVARRNDPLTPAAHASEICGYVHDGTACKLVTGHAGAHVFGTPEWVFGVDPATYVPRYRELEAAMAERRLAIADPQTPAERIEPLKAEIAGLADEQSDLWYALSPAQKDEVDPEGAQARAYAREAGSIPQEAPLSLHERAQQAKAAKAARVAAEQAGTAPPLADDERCPYTPTQGSYAGMRCRHRARHGGPHAYIGQTPAAPAAPAAKKPAPTVPRTPPQPTAAIQQTMTALADHGQVVVGELALLPKNRARIAVAMAVALRQDGLLTLEADYRQLLTEIAAVEFGPAGNARSALDEMPEGWLAQQMATYAGAELDADLAGVAEICQMLPAIPVSQVAFRALHDHALQVDRWRAASGLPPRAEMKLIDRAYACAADHGIALTPPDDFGDYALDELAELERANAEVGQDDVASVEPLSAAAAAWEAMGPVRAIVHTDAYLQAIAHANGITIDEAQRRRDQPLTPADQPHNGYATIVRWVAPADVTGLLAKNWVLVNEDDQEQLRTCWPLPEPEWPEERQLAWVPDADAVAMLTLDPL